MSGPHHLESRGGIPLVSQSLEVARSEALRRVGVLDTPGEQAFDDLTALAARLCAAPISVISMADVDRQWFKSGGGQLEREISRDVSFCAYALAEPDILVVDDLRADPRFAANPMVTSEPHLRFYAGAPLITPEGVAIGTLCVLDVRTRPLDCGQRESLRMLARLVMGQLDLRTQTEALASEMAAKSIAQAGMLESERRFRAIFDHSPVGMGLSDEQGHWVEANGAFGSLLGVEPLEMVGRTALDFVHPDDRHLIQGSERGQRASPHGVWQFEARFVRPDSSTRWSWISITPTSGPAGEHWTLGIVQDITDRKATELALQQSEEELVAVTEVARCTQSGADPRPVIVSCVRGLAKAESVQLLEVSGPDSLVVTAGDGDGVDLSPEDMAIGAQVRRSGQPMASNSAGRRSLWHPVRAEGEVIAALFVTWSEPNAGTERAAVPSRLTRAVRVLADEAGASLRAAQLRSELERSAATDPLTGALNRRAWDRQLADLMRQVARRRVPMTVAVIDLDNFKAYNDTHGHTAGDDLLRQFAERVTSVLRSGDLFARWGGEEFILALSDCDGSRATTILDRIRMAVPAGQTCSIGHTVWNPTEDASVCVSRADGALYAAKRAGRDRNVLG